MPVEVKICGVNSPAALGAAVAGGADYVGFNFYPPSPRYVTPETAREIAAAAPESLTKVGVVVDLDDAALAAIASSSRSTARPTLVTDSGASVPIARACAGVT